MTDEDFATFQTRVAKWSTACFGETIPRDQLERGDRLLEEVFELLQSGDYPPERVAMLRDYVWTRPVGEPKQELGGVYVTLALYAWALGLDMRDAAETELARVWTKVEAIRAKQLTKPKGSPLPAPVARTANVIEVVAEALWQADSERAAGRRRLIAWMDESEKTRDIFRHSATAAVKAYEAIA